ncbi:MAG: aconitase X swivel domain-containing protein [Acidilobaceae archaeon]
MERSSFKEYKGRPVVAGYVDGEVVVVESVSFYGDVNVDSGSLVDGRSIAGRIVLARKGRGSTVGPYILYALKRKGKAPKAIILTSKSDPVLVAGAVLAEVVLVDGVPEDVMRYARDGDKIVVRENGEVVLVK